MVWQPNNMNMGAGQTQQALQQPKTEGMDLNPWLKGLIGQQLGQSTQDLLGINHAQNAYDFALMRQAQGAKRDAANRGMAMINQVHHGPANLPSDYGTTPMAGPWDAALGQMEQQRMLEQLRARHQEPAGSVRSPLDANPVKIDTGIGIQPFAGSIWGMAGMSRSKTLNATNAKSLDDLKTAVKDMNAKGYYHHGSQPGHGLNNPAWYDQAIAAWNNGTYKEFINNSPLTSFMKTRLIMQYDQALAKTQTPVV